MRPETQRGDATIDDLYRELGKAELVNGRIVRMPAASGLHGYAAAQILVSLTEHARRTGVGHAIPDNVGFVVNLPHRKSFCPDVAYHVGPLTMEFVTGAPVFAVEVRSPGDYGAAAERAMAAKRADYFASGTQVVWDVDLLGHDVVRVYRASDPDRPKVYRREEQAEAEPAVPGWSMPVDALFP
jgi:Uma2 family endonuclease